MGVGTCGHLHCEHVALVAWGLQRSGDLTGGNSCGFSKGTVDEDPDNRVDVGGAVVDPNLHNARRQSEVSVVGVGTRRLKLDDRFKQGRLTVNAELTERPASRVVAHGCRDGALVSTIWIVWIRDHPFQVPGCAFRKRRKFVWLDGEGSYPYFVFFYLVGDVGHGGQQVDDVDFRLAVVEDHGWRAIRRDDVNRRAEASRGVGNRLVPNLERPKTEVRSVVPRNGRDPYEEHLAGRSRDGLLVVGT